MPVVLHTADLLFIETAAVYLHTLVRCFDLWVQPPGQDAASEMPIPACQILGPGSLFKYTRTSKPASYIGKLPHMYPNPGPLRAPVS